LPAAAAVRIRFALSLQPSYLNVVLTEKVPITTLLSNIVGLAGIFSLFGMLLGFSDEFAALNPCARNKSGSGIASSEEVGETRRDDERFQQNNPLRAEQGEAAVAAIGAQNEVLEGKIRELTVRLATLEAKLAQSAATAETREEVPIYRFPTDMQQQSQRWIGYGRTVR
jgi:hypothetical protein